MELTTNEDAFNTLEELASIGSINLRNLNDASKSVIINKLKDQKNYDAIEFCFASFGTQYDYKKITFIAKYSIYLNNYQKMKMTDTVYQLLNAGHSASFAEQLPENKREIILNENIDSLYTEVAKPQQN